MENIKTILQETKSLKDTNNDVKLLISRNRNSKNISQKELFDLLELFNLQFILLSKQLRELNLR